ncbi:hypothetical protein AZ66_06700 [Paenibacillus sp. E194]|nr:hypothetical protein AZ66_06700 [Paenibacillus sp. E194]
MRAIIKHLEMIKRRFNRPYKILVEVLFEVFLKGNSQVVELKVELNRFTLQWFTKEVHKRSYMRLPRKRKNNSIEGRILMVDIEPAARHRSTYHIEMHIGHFRRV